MYLLSHLQSSDRQQDSISACQQLSSERGQHGLHPYEVAWTHQLEVFFIDSKGDYGPDYFIHDSCVGSHQTASWILDQFKQGALIFSYLVRSRLQDLLKTTFVLLLVSISISVAIPHFSTYSFIHYTIIIKYHRGRGR